MSIRGLDERASGVLLHVTSLPGPYGSGELGPWARRFVDFLACAGQSWWQTLPINPVGPGNSPYSGLSAFAGSPQLISLEDLAAEGLLAARELAQVGSDERVDYEACHAMRQVALRKAYHRYCARRSEYAAALDEFRARASFWLADYTLFRAASAHHQGKPWTEWEPSLARREETALGAARRAWGKDIAFFEFEQLMVDQQWQALRRYARARGVGLIGDAPLFVAHNSADVWANQTIFRLDRHGQPTHVSGVPPDYFSATGQRWGTPLYRWKRLGRKGYRFWVERLRTLIQRFDQVRLDHFIGFARYWEIPVEAQSAVQGRWMKGPGAKLFEALQCELLHQQDGEPEEPALARLPLIAEDLGCVNRSVRALRDSFRLPGMRVLQFGFGSDDVSGNEHLPHNYPKRCVAYTGTHDTDTIVGWFEDRGADGARSPEQTDRERMAALRYVAGPHARKLPEPVHHAMIRVLFASPARIAMVPMQDWLGLKSEARMNTPGQAEGNWTFRIPASALSADLASELRVFSETYGRCPKFAGAPAAEEISPG